MLAFHFSLKAGHPFYIAWVPYGLIAIYILLIPVHRGLTLVCTLGAFNSMHHLIFLDINHSNEPQIYKITKDVIFFAVFLSVLLKNRNRKKVLFSNLFYNLLPLFIFLFFIFLHAFISFYKGEFLSIAVDLRYLIAYPVLGLLSVGVFDNSAKLKTFLRAMIFTGIVVSGIAIFEVAIGIQTYYWGYINIGPIHQRAISTLQNPNNCALFLVISFFFS